MRALTAFVLGVLAVAMALVVPGVPPTAAQVQTFASPPPDAVAILWADYCNRTGDALCLSPTASPSPSPTVAPSPTAVPTATSSPAPTSSPSASPTITPTSTPSPTPSPAPSSTPSPSPTTTPAPTPPTSGFIGPDPTGPTSGAAWTALRAAADASAGTPDITCNQDSRTHPGTALAAALVYARTGEAAYRAKAIALIEAARATARDCGNAILSLGRQLGAYVLAADYAAYRDASFVAWVSSIRTRDFPSSHSRWHVLADTAANTSNNWGTFALASLTVADAYLHDSAGLARDWAIFTDYGDAGTTRFVHTSSYQAVWSCPTGYEINPLSCTDPQKEGAAVEDASRTTFPTLGNYPAEAAQGYVVQAEVLAKAGYPAWTVNDRQVCRNAKWRERGSNLNRSAVDKYVTWVTNARCGLSQPTVAAGFGRVFGYTDWLYGS